jgi:F-type H+-transporting ATPase subunit delta
MRGASRESYAAATQKLTELATSATPEQLTGVADELLAVARLLQREHRLRRALADPARSGAERSELLGSVLGGKIGQRTQDLLGTLVGGRWSSAADLLDGTETLGVDALLASAEKADDLGEVEDELFRFGQVVDGAPELAASLADASVEVERRATLVSNLLDGKAKPVTTRLAQLALAGYGGRGFAASLTRLVEAAAARRDRQVAYVTVSAPLSEAEEQRLGSRLSEMYGREVALKITVDPKILGGLSVLVGNDLYDGTVLRKLQQTRAALAK